MPEGRGSIGELAERAAYPFDAGSAFVLAAGGLHRLRGDGGAFLGYSGREMFWKDVLELVHEEDLSRAGKLVSGSVGKPDAVLNAALRMRDASGAWRRVKATVRNVAEAPDDDGFVLAEFLEVDNPNGHGRPRNP